MHHRAIKLYKYHQWANEKFFEHLKELPSDVYENKITSVFNSISQVIKHLYQTDGLWLSVISGDSFKETMSIVNKLQKQTKEKSLQQMQHLYDELSEQYLGFFEDEEDLDKEIEIDHPEFGKLKTPISKLVQHVVNHGTYHRGNLTAMLRQQGYPGVPNDYLIYLYKVK